MYLEMHFFNQILTLVFGYSEYGDKVIYDYND